MRLQTQPGGGCFVDTRERMFLHESFIGCSPANRWRVNEPLGCNHTDGVHAKRMFVFGPTVQLEQPLKPRSDSPRNTS